MITIVRTNSENSDFITLVKLLDADLARRDGNEHEFYAQFNKISALKYTIVAYEDDQPVACGAIRPFDENSMEVKRMFCLPEARGRGIATAVLNELETWTKALNYRKCILETGKRQPEAIALYTKNGYSQTANYGQYTDVENSVCFGKQL